MKKEYYLIEDYPAEVLLSDGKHSLYGDVIDVSGYEKITEERALSLKDNYLKDRKAIQSKYEKTKKEALKKLKKLGLTKEELEAIL